jgi:hypothetical protein
MGRVEALEQASPKAPGVLAHAAERFGMIVGFCAFLLLCICFQAIVCDKSYGADGPEVTVAGEKGPDKEEEFNLGAWFASFFSKHISPIDGSRCPSHPSCSSYSAQAFKKHGFVMGWLMTVDRLMHESDEDKTSPVVVRNGKGKIMDPLENNDFWWYSENKED